MSTFSAPSPFLSPLVSRLDARPAVFRLPSQMHVPKKLITIDFQLEPQMAWIARSFIAWFHPSLKLDLPWML